MVAARKYSAPRRRALASLEFLLVLPVLLAVVLAIAQMSMTISATQQLSAASAQGARVAAQGGGCEEIAVAAQRVLGDGRLADAKIEILIADKDGRPLDPGENVQVRVSIPATHAVPNLLKFIGLSTEGQTLVGQTTLRKE